MQLRRSLAVTAVTALASSAAIFAAPVAFAADPSVPPTNPGVPTQPVTAPTVPPVGNTATGQPTKPATEAPTKLATQEPQTPATQAPAPPAAAAETPVATPQLPAPGEVIPNPNKGNGPTVAFKNFPGKLVPGAGAQEFQAVATNTTGKKVEIAPEIYVANDKETLKAEHVKIEYFRDGKWKTVRLVDLNGAVYGVIGGDWYVENDDYFYEKPYDLAAGKSLEIKLRISVTKSAPVSIGVGALAGVSWVGGEDNASLNSYSDYYVFYIVQQPSDVTPPKPTAKPKPKPKPAKPGKELASTGGDSSSATTFAIAGGVALVGGAGLLVVMRRRKGGSSAAA